MDINIKLLNGEPCKLSEKHDIHYKYQSGFRRSYFTETALIDLSDRIKFSMDKGLHT